MSTSEPPDMTTSAVAELAARIWREALDAPAAEDARTFFELGGQSISAVRIVTAVHEDIGVTVELADLFEDPDLQTFVELVLARTQPRPRRPAAPSSTDVAGGADT